MYPINFAFGYSSKISFKYAVWSPWLCVISRAPNKGVEPILPGVTEDEGFQWCIDSINECLPHAQQAGVVLALENHWGLTRTPEGLLRIVNSIDSPMVNGIFIMMM